MALPYIPEYAGEPFDFFDALGLVPKSTYTKHDIQAAWRKAFKILHSDKKHVNGTYVPAFPTVDHITKAKDWLLEDPDHIEIAHEQLAGSYKSTWNPHAKAGTPAVLQPIPGAVADPLRRRPRQPLRRVNVYHQSADSHDAARATAAWDYQNARNQNDEYYAYWQNRSRAQSPPPPPHARPRREGLRREPDAQEIINDTCEQWPGLEPYLRPNNVFHVG